MGTSIDKLNYMSTTKTKIKDAINLTNVNITNDTFRSYETKFKQGIVNTLNNPDAVWSNFTKVTGTGESLTLTPTEHAPMLVTLKGQTTQASTPTPSTPQPVNVVSGEQDINVTGKNLLPNNNTTTQTINSVTFTKNDDKSITISGTASATTDYYFVGTSNEYVDLGLEAGNYNLNGVTGGSGSTYMLYCVQNRNGTLYYYQSVDTTGLTIAVQSGDKFRFFIRVMNGKTPNATINPQLEKGTTPTTYEPYGNTYEINLGKNLCTTKGNNTIIATLTTGTYTFSFKSSIGGGYILKKDNSSGTNLISQQYFNANTTPSITFTINETTNVFINGYSNESGKSFGDYTSDWQLEKGSTKTDYSPYKTPIELCKIGTYQDYIRKSTGKNLFDKDNANIVVNKYLNASGEETSDGSFSISDYIKVKPNTSYSLTPFQNMGACVCFYDSSKTFISSVALYSVNPSLTTPNNCEYIRSSFRKENLNTFMINEGSTATTYEPYGKVWYLHKEIGKVVLNGSENWGLNQYGFFQVEVQNTTSDSSKRNGYSNYFKYAYNTTTDNTFFPVDNLIRFRCNTFSNVNDFKTWLGTNNPIVYYVLATPTDTQIEDSELLEQLESIKSCDGVTNISQSSSYEVSILDAIAIKQLGGN